MIIQVEKSSSLKTDPVLTTENNMLNEVKRGDTLNVRRFMRDIYDRLYRDADIETIVSFEMLVNSNDASIEDIYKNMVYIFKENRYPVSDYKHILIDKDMITVVYNAVAA